MTLFHVSTVEVAAQNAPKIFLDNFGNVVLNDDRWHKIILTLATNLIVLIVDVRPMKTVRIMTSRKDANYLIGGGVPGTPGFIGCMRQINVDGTVLYYHKSGFYYLHSYESIF